MIFNAFSALSEPFHARQCYRQAAVSRIIPPYCSFGGLAGTSLKGVKTMVTGVAVRGMPARGVFMAPTGVICTAVEVQTLRRRFRFISGHFRP